MKGDRRRRFAMIAKTALAGMGDAGTRTTLEPRAGIGVSGRFIAAIILALVAPELTIDTPAFRRAAARSTYASLDAPHDIREAD